jgi:tryptophan-rich sensory protein
LAAGSHGCVAFRPYAAWEAFASALNGPIFVLK